SSSSSSTMCRASTFLRRIPQPRASTAARARTGAARLRPPATIRPGGTPVNAVERLAHVFAEDGRSLYLVGGPVRDELLGLPVRDYDFTTAAEPEDIKRLLRAADADAIYT